MIVFLMGFMTSGKTSFGKKLARTIDFDFIDLDDLIEKKNKTSINNIFFEKGEQYFRKIESQILENIITSSSQKNRVVALGGGTPCFNDNINKIKANNILIYLELDVKNIIGRLKVDKANRPIVKDLNDFELVQKVNQLFKQRENFYKQAHLILNAQDSVSKLKQEVISFIENQK